MNQTNRQTPRILIIPGSKFQLPLIRKVKEMGFKVFCADRSEQSVCKNEVDGFRNIDLNNREKLLEFAQEIKANAIITDQTDTAVRTTAYLCQCLSICGIGESVAELYTNKLKMRIFGQLNNLPTPKFKLCNNIEDIKSFIENVGCPIILKPISNQSSKGVCKIDFIEEIQDLYKKTLNYSESNQILAEEFIEGVEFTVEGYKTKTKHYTLAISQKDHYHASPLVAYQLLYTYDTRFNLGLLKDTNNKFVEMSDLPFGITHAEYKFSNNQFYLIEIAARGGGNRISSDLIPAISGIDIYKYLILNSLGYETSINISDNHCSNHGLLEFFTFPEGQVKMIYGIEKSKKIHGVIDVFMNLKPGDFVLPPSDDTQEQVFS